MRILPLITCLAIFLSSSAYSQTLSRTGFQAQYDSVRALVKARKLEEALNMNRQLLHRAEESLGDADTTTLKIRIEYGATHERLRRYDKALEIYERALKLYKPNYGKAYAGAIKSLRSIARVHDKQQLWKKSQLIYHEIARIQAETYGDKHIETGKALFDLGGVYYEQSQYDTARLFFQQAAEIYKESLGEQHAEVGRVYDWIGRIHHRMGDLDTALNYFNQELAIKLKSVGETHGSIATSYVNLGGIHLVRGDSEQALVYYQKALDVKWKIYQKENFSIANTYHLMGIASFESGKFEDALEYFQRSLDIKLRFSPPEHYLVRASYTGMAGVYFKQANFDKALEIYLENLSIIENIGNLDNLETAGEAYHNIAVTYFKKKAFGKALSYHFKALELQKENLAPIHPKLVSSYWNIGLVYKNMNDPSNALSYFQLALEAAGLDLEKPQVEALDYSPLLIKVLAEMVQINERESTDSIPDQKTLLSLAFDINQHFGTLIKSRNSKIDFQNSTYFLYETALNAALSGESMDEKEMFSYAEQSKAAVLRSEVSNTFQKAYQKLPEDLQNEDQRLKKEIAYIEKRRFDELKKKEVNDSLIRVLNDERFALKREQEELFLTLERDHKEFFHLTSDNRTTPLERVQELLEPDQALIEYFVGENDIFILVVDRSGGEVQHLKRDFPLAKWVDQMRKGIFLPEMDLQLSKSEKDSLREQYLEAAHQLHQKLIEPISISLPKRLIIVPGGVLGYLPFDALLASMPEDPDAYRSYDLLLKKHAISYNYSATLYEQILGKPSVKARKPLLAVAPYFGDERDAAYLASRTVSDLRDTLLPLRFNVPEIAYLHQQIGGDTLTGKNARLDRFLEMASDYQVLHLSTHGKANDREGDYSYLAFTEVKDSLQNERLYVRELYNQEFNADMVVLSACETGLGELQRSEGVIGMTRGFLYAGAKSIITSLWNVNDKSTQVLMGYFYDGLREGLPKDVALQQAKLQLLARNYPEPFHWASFTAMGNMKPLEFASAWPDWWVSILIGLAGTGLVAWLSHKQRKEKQ